uniref:MYND-type domain-containing protein n=1 Tax=Grammatophora oceanica TaxID=210454 RepID=A0A7S1YHP2_9STRA|mmetsp:Transcript_47135/g.70111  ORF Transcript_47135/g.70111 Transcript_47135/m.70111 type:complete len:167 (+) Transcript_47135:230-730(+)
MRTAIDKHKCWFCKEAITHRQNQICAKCDVARYCSKKCQKSDWKNDHHKGFCKSLGKLNTRYNRELDYVDAAMDGKNTTNEAGGRINLEPSMAYREITRVVFADRVPPETVKGPHMEYLHENLTKLAQGDFVWLFHEVIPKVNIQKLSPIQKQVLFGEMRTLMGVV